MNKTLELPAPIMLCFIICYIIDCCLNWLHNHILGMSVQAVQSWAFHHYCQIHIHICIERRDKILIFFGFQSHSGALTYNPVIQMYNYVMYPKCFIKQWIVNNNIQIWPGMREIWDFIVQSKIISRGEAEGNNFAEDNKITYFSNKGDIFVLLYAKCSFY